MIIKRKSGEIPCPLAVEAFAAHLSYICKYDDKYSKYVRRLTAVSRSGYMVTRGLNVRHNVTYSVSYLIGNVHSGVKHTLTH